MEIEIGYIELTGVIKGDMLDVSFDIEHDLDLTGKSLRAEVIADPVRSATSGVVLSFNESDESLVKTISTSTLMTVRLYKKASDMEIAPGKYLIAVAMGTDPEFEDRQTLVRGKVNVLVEI